MKTTPTRRFLNVLCLLAVLLGLLPGIASAQQTLYWDSNGTTTGAGTTPSGTWGSSAFWSTSSAGTSATANTLTTALDTLIFSAGTDAINPYTVTVNGTQNARTLSIEEGAVTFAGGTIALGGAGGITVAAGAGNATLSSNLSITGAQTFNIGSGRTLALNTGSFTRNPGAVLNVQSAGTVTSTMTGLSANNAAGIVGAWASIGTGTATRYATFSGSTFTALTGTAAANAAALTDTTGLVNYELAGATGTMPATVSANTIRYTGVAATTSLGASSFSVNGLMNASSFSPWTIAANTLTIGGDMELVVNTANQSIFLNSAIQNNGGGASSLTKTGLGLTGGVALFLGGANTYTGGTNVNEGALVFLNTSAKPAIGTVTVAAGATLGLGVATSGAFFTSANVDSLFAGTLAGVTNDAASGVGIDTTAGGFTYATSVDPTTRGLVKLGSNTLTLTGASSYTGATTVAGGTLSVATISNGGVPGTLGASSNAAANLVLTFTGALQYTGASATTDRNFTMGVGSTGTIQVTNPATNLTFTGASAATNGALSKTGPGTLTFAGSNLHSGITIVNAGTLVLDFTASNTSKLIAALTLRNGTLQLDRSSGANGSHIENIASTTLSGGGRITRGTGSTAVLRMNAINRIAGSALNFGAGGIADTDTTNTNGLLGNGRGWATIGGADWARNSTNGADGPITAFTAYTDITRQSSGTKAIADGSTSNVRIVEGSGGAPDSLTLGAVTTTINTLNQSASGGTNAATINTAGQTLMVHGILVGPGAGALTIGTADANRGTLQTATSGGELILQNFGSNGLTINSNITDLNSSALTHAGNGTTVLAGPNSNYTGATNIVGGTLEVSGGGQITATNAVTLDGGALTVNGTTASSVTSTGTLFVADYSSGTLAITSGGTVSNTIGYIANNSATVGSVTVSGTGSAWTNSSLLRVGSSGSGTLGITSGGTVSNTNGFVGFNAGSAGSVTVSGAGSAWTNSGNLLVGNFGKGTLIIDSGGEVSNLIGYIGNSAGSTGTVTVSGTGSTWNNSTQISVGSGGSGTLAITNGGTVTNSGNSLIGVIAGSVGSATVSGAGSTWTSNGSITVGNSGSGTLNISAGGLVRATRLDGGNAGSSVNLDGGTLSITTTDSASNTINLHAAGGTFDIPTAATIFTITSGISGAGGLTKTGQATLTLSGANGYAGATTVNTGTLSISADNNLGTAPGVFTANQLSIAQGGRLAVTTGFSMAANRGITVTAGAGSSGMIDLAAGQTLTVAGGIVKNGTVLELKGGAGSKFNLNGVISGASPNSDLIVNGGTTTLSMANTYTGPTSVINGGTLNLTNTNGSATGTGDVTIDMGSTLAGTGRADTGANNYIYLNGTLSVGSSVLGSPVASQLELVTSGTGSTILGSGGSVLFDLFSGAGLGDSTGIAAAADRIKLFGDFDTSLGGQIVLGNPSLMSGFAEGDVWRLFDLSGGGSITDSVTVDFTALMLGAGLTGNFDHTSGVFSINAVPEPSRALLLLIGLAGGMLRRRRR